MIKHLTTYIVIGIGACSFFYQTGVYVGVERGRVAALRSNPPDEELEMVCAGLWIGEQNRKYHRKENEPK